MEAWIILRHHTKSRLDPIESGALKQRAGCSHWSVIAKWPLAGYGYIVHNNFVTE